MPKTIGFVGLGKMGSNIVAHLREQGIAVVSWNRTPKPEASVSTLQELTDTVKSPRIVFLSVPNGAVDEVVSRLALTPGDILIDGGNTYYKDSVRRANDLQAKGITFIDCGTSGGLDGARHGACLMLGGEEKAVTALSWLWDAIATGQGWAYMGPSGAGHFVKTVHNGIEYGMDQAIGEGLDILAQSPYRLDLKKIADVWTHGSIIRSYLVALLSRALQKDPKLTSCTGNVGGGETGTWALDAAREEGVAAPVLEQSLEARKISRTKPSFSSKVISALRREYGGHTEAK